MSLFVEAVMALLPTDAGGLRTPLAPRDGVEWPLVRSAAHEPLFRFRVIEGPASVGPGDLARVLAEVEEGAPLTSGSEAELVEEDARLVGLLVVTRAWSRTLEG